MHRHYLCSFSSLHKGVLMAAFPLWRFDYKAFCFSEVFRLDILISAEKTVDDNQWWKDIFRLVVAPGDYFEIHCWSKENKEIQIAEQFGEQACFGMPNLKIMHGTLNERLVSFLLTQEKPKSQFYNKMIPFYTIHIGDLFSSEDYGTKVILRNKSKRDKEQIEKVLFNIDTEIKTYYKNKKQDIWRPL